MEQLLHQAGSTHRPVGRGQDADGYCLLLFTGSTGTGLLHDETFDIPDICHGPAVLLGPRMTSIESIVDRWFGWSLHCSQRTQSRIRLLLVMAILFHQTSGILLHVVVVVALTCRFLWNAYEQPSVPTTIFPQHSSNYVWLQFY
jgi:hypothetical protein